MYNFCRELTLAEFERRLQAREIEETFDFTIGA